MIGDPLNFDPLGRLDDRLARLYGPRQQRNLVNVNDVSPDDENLLSKLAGGGLSALQYIGRTLDKTLGGATIRSLLGGQDLGTSLAQLIPFSDTLGITKPDDVPSGRQLLEQGGILDPKQPGDGFDLGDVGGIAAEVLLDPATYLSGGTTALAKSAPGQIATKALGESGLLDALTERVGSTLKQGWRQGAIKNTLADVLSATPEARGAMETAAGGKGALDSLLAANEPLGGLARVHAPFMPSVGFNVGTGDTGAKVASYLDSLGEAARYSGPWRVAASLFSYPSRGVLSKEGQLARQATTADTSEAVAAAIGDLLPHIRKFEEAGLAGPEGSRMLNDVFEGLGQLPPEHAALQPSVDAVKDIVSQMPADYKDLGLNLKEWDSQWTDYLARQAVPGPRSFKGGRAFPTSDQFQMGRMESFDVPGGKNMLNDMSVDPMISGPKRLATDDADAVAHIRQTYGIADEKQAKSLAGYFSQLDPKHAAGTPLFPNHPLADTLERVKAAAKTKAATEGAYKFLGDYLSPSGSEFETTALKDILDKMGLKRTADETGAFSGALQNMAAKFGVSPEDVVTFRVPNDIAADATRMVKTFQTPDAVKVVLNKLDKFESWFKTWVTAPFPGFHVRNKATGMVSDLIGGINPTELATNHIDATKLLAGDTIKGLAKSVPGFAGMTDEEATKALAELTAKHGLYRGGQIAADIAPETQSVANIIPGVVPSTFGTAAKSILPDALQGIENDGTLFGKLKGALPHPAKAGLAAGNIVEDGNRIASFLGLMKQGWDEFAAAAKSKVMHGSYSELTDFEKSVMKRLIPFYSFTRLVVPNFVKDILQNPGGITAQAVRAENRLRSDAGFIPDQVGQGLAIPLGSDASGNSKFLADSGVLPIENLNDLFKPGHTLLDTARRTGEAILGQSNPLLKGPLELMTGKQFYTDRDLRDLKTHFGAPPLIEQLVMNSPAARVLSTTSKLADDRKSLGERALNVLTGARTTDVNLDQSKDIAARQGIEELLRGETGVTTHPGDIYIDKQNLALMSPDEQKLWSLYSSISKRAQARAKQKKQQAQIAGSGAQASL